VDYNMIGGLQKQIEEVIETLELPLTNPELLLTWEWSLLTAYCFTDRRGMENTHCKSCGAQSQGDLYQDERQRACAEIHRRGARLVRDVFNIAREKAPSIVFIDEIDAVGSRRTYDGTTGSSEVNRTMVQLLAELDGFDTRGDVRIVAATNRIDLLDPALLRPAGLTGLSRYLCLMRLGAWRYLRFIHGT